MWLGVSWAGRAGQRGWDRAGGVGRLAVLVFAVLSFTSYRTHSACGRSSVSSVTRSDRTAIGSPRVPSFVRFTNRGVGLGQYSVHRHLSHRVVSFYCVRSGSLLVVGHTGHCLPRIREVLGRRGVPSSFGCLVVVRDGISPLTHSTTNTTKF